ncbi:phasin family protein [Marinobacterium lutimaris]|uniref:Phasin family protein n=1 Tax=Marinobacterium lutimaris TaxID=568106 RepID=A0A1H5UW25_9GAMM|nr:phasin family protein [Marinobacterium lutimaris]SEF79269.1 phasin family protein [Marinobacterium lutimaris]
MYDDMLKEMKEKMAPVVEMAEINKKTAETLISLQSDYFSDFVNSSLAQVKALTEVKDPKEAFDLQVKYFKDLEGKMTGVAEKEMAALTQAKDELTTLVEKSVSEMGEMPYFDMEKFADMSKFDFSAFDMTKFMPEAVAPKAKPAAKTTTRKTTAASASATA